MSLKTILVHLNASDRSHLRLKFAAKFARERGARLTGLFAQAAPAHQVGLVAQWPSADYVAAAEASKAEFLAEAAGLDAEWVDLNRGDENELVMQTVDFARHFDLIVIGQRMPDHSLHPPEFAETLIIESGRPVLVLPNIGDFASIGARPVFAWSDSAASARALSDGLQLVAPGVEALVVGLTKAHDDAGAQYQKQSLRLAVAQLAAHGVSAHAEQLTFENIGLMDALLNRVADHGGDLLALGGFGGGGYPLFSRGSGSRYILKSMTAPVLFSH